MDINELMQKKEKIKYLENLLSGYEKKDTSVYELILLETNHPAVNFFMIDKAAEELKVIINTLKNEVEVAEKFVDKDASTKKQAI